jgi:hypothetical protein
VEGIASSFGAKVEIRIDPHYPVLVNSNTEAEHVLRVARAVLGDVSKANSGFSSICFTIQYAHVVFGYRFDHCRRMCMLKIYPSWHQKTLRISQKKCPDASSFWGPTRKDATMRCVTRTSSTTTTALCPWEPNFGSDS